MIQIEKIEIYFFRSIYHITISDMRDLTILSGKNDCGKSNILRALNLFFNNHTGWEEPFDFKRDFNRKRLIECQQKVKSKQFIQIKIHFMRGKRYENSLPDKFWVSRTWSRNASLFIENNSLRKGEIPTTLDRALASLQRYLGTIVYEYIPAIKDRSFFGYSLGLLQDAILMSRENQELSKVITDLNKTVRSEASSLHSEFYRASGVIIDIHLPENMEELFRAFAVSTGGNENFPLTVRGDGIQARFLPSLLYHVASNSTRHYIWGFEEPENCLEHGLATLLAKDMQTKYSKDSQIILTSHSPAFIGLTDNNISAFRVFSEESTSVSYISDKPHDLHNDLGLIELQKKYQKEYEAEMSKLQHAKEFLEKSHKEATKPILLVEGITDVMILEEAWKRIHKTKDRQYIIKSCNVAAAEDNETKAGCGILSKALESCRTDQPKLVGLFDYDKEGMTAFKLNNNFQTTEHSKYVKISKTQHVAAIILPEVTGKEEYLRYQNFIIEYIFPENCITKIVNGKGLVLEQMKIHKKLPSGHELEPEITTAHYHRVIKDGKKHFAEIIVPSFDDKDFSNFIPLFNLIENTFEKLK